jgi:lipopolysaccharide/colanic/teichoic acid biosynthesis glycosyltransferase
MKRAIDVCGALLALLLLLPVIAIVAIAVRIAMGSPVLFRHVRAGYRGEPFVLFKFRSMRDAFGPDGAALPDAERLTPFGAFLRSTSLDELPELWNVLAGHMSLVGPRPLLMEYLPLYSPEQARRHEVRPGLTGWAQVNGRNALSWEQKLAYDVWYVEHRSVWLDLRILCASVAIVLRAEGIAQAGHVTAGKFPGNVR